MLFNTATKSTKIHITTSLRHTLGQNFAKLVTAKQAVRNIKDGDKILSGGFGVCGKPITLIEEILNQGKKDLTIVTNSGGIESYGVGRLIKNRLVKRMVSSYIGQNKEFESQYLRGELELEITPQGTLAEKIRAAGKGIPAFWTPTGADTVIETGGFAVKLKRDGKTPEILSKPKETRIFNGK